MLTALPDHGYIAAGWAGACRGITTTSIHVNGPKMCAALFEPLASPSPRTLLYVDGQPGLHVGGGRVNILSPMNSGWVVTASADRNHVQVRIHDVAEWWALDFAAPEGQALAPGYYSAARRWPLTTFNGLQVAETGRGCSDPTGRFVILELSIAADGTLERFAADFEAHGMDDVPGLFGAIRYNATTDEVVPFGGLYPSYTLSVTPPEHGRIAGIGLNCGNGASRCTWTLAAAAEVPLTAEPNAGYVFTGWTQDCSGGEMTLVHINGPKRCAASFEPIVASSARTLLRWDASPPAMSGNGRSEVLTPANSRWRATAYHAGTSVEFWVRSVGPKTDSRWTLHFRPPEREFLQAGRHYLGVVGSFPGPGMAALGFTGDNTSCTGGAAEFTIRELVIQSGEVVRFAATFAIDCGAGRRTGLVQYNSLVAVPLTTLSLEPSSLRFVALHNGAAILTQPAPELVRLRLNRPDAGWTAVANQPWIQLSPAAGMGSATLTIALDVRGRHPGTVGETGRVTLRLTDGSGALRIVDLSLMLSLTGTTAPPFGYIDTPYQNIAGVTGAIPMTGWALDDLEVAAVTICRAAVGGEVAPLDPNCGGAAQIYVGNGVFIEGARPDVRTGYPTYPRNNNAGWGFMILTNVLPDQGNGTFVFSVYALDREGHVALIGTRTMTCNNATAMMPFGTIDTPAQGETITGTSYLNFGWALTPDPKQISGDGSTLMVYVDGVPIGSPTYNQYRDDIATLFPGFANSNGAVGFRAIDTTTLTNGLHTIVWTATDSAGLTSGLGSRFFRVANATADAAVEPVAAALPSSALDTLPLDSSALSGRRGWAPEARWASYAVGRSGRAVLRGEELDRFELALGAYDDATYAGYLRVGAALEPLPSGSRLDARTGAFTWSPGVGFVGQYDVVFVQSAVGRPMTRREVRFILNPKTSGHVGARVVIDTPRAQQDLAQPFLLGGWAADLDAAHTTGIDTLHVWAYPLAGGPPVFLGTATYGGTRADVAAVHGDQFRDSGFGIAVRGLTPGHYDLAAFAWSNVSGGFVPAQVVRITAR